MAPSHYKEHLFELLPRLYHTYDRNSGALKDFLAAVGATLDDMEHNIAGLYDDSFIETCREWVVPYIGQLIGARLIENDGNRNRQEVMQTIGWRRSKGTLATLEDVAREITGWGVHAAEFFEQIGWSQNLNHIKADHLQTPDLRDNKTLFALGGARNSLLHSADIRRPGPRRGWFQIKNIGFFLSTVALSHYRQVPLRRVQHRPYHFALDARRRPLTLFDGPSRFPLSQTLAQSQRDAHFGTGRTVDVYFQGVLAATPKVPKWTGSPAVAAPDAALLDLADNEGLLPVDWKVQDGEPLKYTVSAMVLYESGGNARLDPLGDLDLSTAPLEYQRLADGSTRSRGRLVMRVTAAAGYNRAFSAMVLKLQSRKNDYAVFTGQGDLRRGIYQDRSYVYLPAFHSGTDTYFAIDRYGSAYFYDYDPTGPQPADENLYNFTRLARATEGVVYPSRQLTAANRPAAPIYSLAKSDPLQIVDRGQFLNTRVPTAGWTVKAWNQDNAGGAGGGVLRLLTTVKVTSVADAVKVTLVSKATVDRPGHLIISLHRTDANPIGQMEIIVTDERGNALLVYLPQIDVITGDGAYLYVAADGATYRVNARAIAGGLVIERTPQAGPGGAFNPGLLGRYAAGQCRPIMGKTPIQHRIPVRCDLSTYIKPAAGLLAIDPDLGRVAFADQEKPRMPLSASYYHGFASYLGAGAYYHDWEAVDESRIIRVAKRSAPDDTRHLRPPADGVVSQVRIFRTLQAALDEVVSRGASRAADGTPWVIQIEDSEIYTENCHVSRAIASGVILRAAQFEKPFWRGRLIWDGPADEVTPLVAVQGMLLGHTPRFRTGRFNKIKFKDCTLLRNLMLLEDVRGAADRYPALSLENCILRKRLSVYCHCAIDIKNCALDSTKKNALVARRSAVEIERSTVLKKVKVKTLTASESIFMDKVRAANPQQGCIRYCRTTPQGNRLPRVYKCTQAPVTFCSDQPWQSSYLKLKRNCRETVTHWAENGGEIGVYHQAHYTLKQKNLALKFNEYLPVGLQPVLIDRDC